MGLKADNMDGHAFPQQAADHLVHPISLVVPVNHVVVVVDEFGRRVSGMGRSEGILHKARAELLH